MRTLFIVVALLVCLSEAAVVLNKAVLGQLREDFKFGKQQYLKLQSVRQKHHLDDISIQCGLCGIAANEVYGFAAENLTDVEIEQMIQQEICDNLNSEYKTICDNLLADLPIIVEHLEQIAVICVELGYCQQPFSPHPDPFPMPKYVINMDLPPLQRWTEICSNESYIQNAQYFVSVLQSMFAWGGRGKLIDDVGKALNDYYLPTEYALEIKGCAEAFNISYGWLTWLNLGYEVSDDCTSIIAQTEDGIIYHGRNMDFGDGMGFTETLRGMAVQVEWQVGGEPLFYSTGFAGFVGVLSGFKANKFSMTIDTRFYPGWGIEDMLCEVVAALLEKNASLVTFLSRSVMEYENDFASALENLCYDPLVADVYYIIAGISAGEGAVISRNRTRPADIWMLDAPSRWFEVETNYDHWEPPPWYDNRLVPANNGMEAMGRQNMTLDGILQVRYCVETTYTILSCPAQGFFESFIRYCPYPCAE